MKYIKKIKKISILNIFGQIIKYLKPIFKIRVILLTIHPMRY